MASNCLRDNWYVGDGEEAAFWLAMATKVRDLHLAITSRFGLLDYTFLQKHWRGGRDARPTKFCMGTSVDTAD